MMGLLCDSDAVNCLLQEVLVNGILVPTIDLLSDPDYINQYVAWLVSSVFCCMHSCHCGDEHLCVNQHRK